MEKKNAGKTALSIISGALLGGFMWHIRGSGGFGGSWGLLAFGTAMTLFVFLFYGNREKFRYELIPVGALMTAFAVYSNGSVINMAGGTLISSVPFTGEDYQRMIPMSQVRGIIIMCLAGFALVCLFGIFVGTLFSKREYKLRDYLVYVITFYLFDFGSKASVSHLIAKKLLPQLIKEFENGLADRGINGISPMKFYLQHFNNMHFADNFPYGYTYFETIEHISFFIAAVALILVALIVFKDKTTARVSLSMNLVGAVAFTLPDYFIVSRFETSFLSKLNIPDALRLTNWGAWEYGVGFILGLGLAIIIAAEAKKNPADTRFRTGSQIENRTARFVFNFVGFGLVLGVSPARALACRIVDTFIIRGEIADDDPYEIIGIILLGIIAAIVFLLVIKKNIISEGLPVPFKMNVRKFAGKSLLIYVTGLTLAKVFTGDDDSIFTIMYFRDHGITGAYNFIVNCGYYVMIAMLVSFVVCTAIFGWVAGKNEE